MTENGRSAAARAIRVLVVDDNEGYRIAISSMLELHGALEIVGHAPNGLRGISLTRALRPDVVLMDLEMPVMGGIDATHAITSGGSGARVLILTASAKAGDRERATAAGAVAFLTKDQTIVEIADAIVKAWEGPVVPPTAPLSSAPAVQRA